MDVQHDEIPASGEPLMAPLEEVEQRAGSFDEPLEPDTDQEGVPVLTRSPLPMPGMPYAPGVVVDPTADEAGKAAEEGLPADEVEAQRRAGA